MRPWFAICAIALVAFHPARAADFSSNELSDARKLYTTKCAKCHKLYDPAKYSDTEWIKWMTKMSKKTKLKEAQQELLARYLETLRTTAQTNQTAPPN